MKRPVTIFSLLLAATTLAACLDDDITGTRPLSFTMQAEAESAATGDSIYFAFEGTGTSIIGVIVTFGDGVADTTETVSSSTVQMAGRAGHVYTDAGDYQVVGTLYTPTGNRADTVSVQIVAGGT